MTNPIYNALNKRLLIFGVERGMFSAVMLLAVIVFYVANTVIGAIGVFSVIYAAVRRATREDPRLPAVLLAHIRLAQLYDSAMRQ